MSLVTNVGRLTNVLLVIRPSTLEKTLKGWTNGAGGQIDIVCLDLLRLESVMQTMLIATHL